MEYGTEGVAACNPGEDAEHDIKEDEDIEVKVYIHISCFNLHIYLKKRAHFFI
jgi:hypothetical protein